MNLLFPSKLQDIVRNTSFEDLTDEEMEKAQIPKGLIHLSVGMEKKDDLTKDLK